MTNHIQIITAQERQRLVIPKQVNTKSQHPKTTLQTTYKTCTEQHSSEVLLTVTPSTLGEQDWLSQYTDYRLDDLGLIPRTGKKFFS
jgi:hypothetical protein